MIKLKQLITEQNTEVRRIFLDLDGVLADFDNRFRDLAANDKVWNLAYGDLGLDPKVLQQIRNQTLTTDREDSMNVLTNAFTKLGIRKARWAIIDKIDTKFWTGMDLMPGAQALVQFVETLNLPIEILTAGSHGNAKIGKIEWLKNQGLGKYAVDGKFNLVLHGIEKGKLAKPGDILIDDMAKNIKIFRDAGGMAIHHINTPKSIAELKKYLRT